MNVCKRVIVAIGCLSVMISAAGCANKEVVKKDEPIVAKETTAKYVVAPKVSPDERKETVQRSAPAIIPQQTVKAATSQSAFEKVYFDFDSSDLSKSARDSLTRDSEILLKERRDAKLRIEGNCDERGSAEYNLALGERRAKAAVKYLTTLGVQPERLETISYGKERPAVQGNDETAWSKNRRDEFVIQK
jgi:peptidoglycan-associated lipoprotein